MKRLLVRFLVIQIALPTTLLAQEAPPGQPSDPGVPFPPAALVRGAGDTADVDAGTGGESTFAPDLFTGAASVRFQLPLPAGRNGMNPNLELKYGQRAGASWVGSGWGLSLGAIELDPAGELGGAGARYFHRSPDGPTRLFSAPSLEAYRCPEPTCYWQERDIDRTRYRLVRPGGQPPYWIATDRSGREYVFGRSLTARISSPADAQLVVHWALESIEDAFGNSIKIAYEVERGHTYPREISYSQHPELPALYLISFLTEPISPDLPDYSYGFERRLSRQLSAITVHAAGHPFSAFQLVYGTGESSGRYLLESVQEFGADFIVADSKVIGGTSFPPHRFEYDTSVRHRRTVRTRLPTEDGELYGRSWIDFDGNGLVDYCRLMGSRAVCDLYDASDIRRVSSAVTDPGYPNSRAWIDFNNDGKSDFCRIVGNRGAFRIRCSPSSGESFGNDYTSGIIGSEHEELARAWLDANGDGFIDFCRATTETSWPDLPTEQDLLSNAGPGRLKCTLGAKDGFSGGALNLVGQDIEIGRIHGWSWIDVSGDRRPDFCRVIGKPIVPIFPSPNPLPGPDPSEPKTGRVDCLVNRTDGFYGNVEGAEDIHLGDFEGRLWTDVNGDGLGDYCRVVSGDRTVCTMSSRTALHHDLVVSAGTGEKVGRTWADINSDGRADYCRVISTGVGKAASCAVPTAAGTTAEVRVSDWLAEPLAETRTWVDVDMDGSVDYCRREPMAEGGSRYACMARERPSLHLLRAQVEPLGRRTEIVFAAAPTTVGIPLVTLAEVKTLDEWGEAKLTYSFSGARWDYAQSEFAGFATGITSRRSSTDDREVISRTRFEQGIGSSDLRARRGLPLSIEVAFGAETVSFTHMSYVEDPTAPYSTPVKAIESTTCEANRCRTSTVRYEHDLFGNVVQEIHRTEDRDSARQREIRRKFAANEATWILGLPSEETLLDDGATQLAHTEWRYDGDLTCSGADPGSSQPLRGVLTQTRRWVTDDQYVTSSQGYGRAGQVVCKRDGRGAVTLFSYDDSESFPLNIEGPRTTLDGATAPTLTSTGYLAGVNAPLQNGGRFGTPIRSVDARGEETLRAFDSLGRIIKETRPGAGTRTVKFSDLGRVGQQRVAETHSSGVWSTTWLDSSGRPRRVAEGVGAGGDTRFRDLHYDNMGHLVTETEPYRQGEEVIKRFARYDSLGRRIAAGSSGATSQYCYAPGIEVVISGGKKVRRTYTPEGELLGVEEFAGSFGQCDVGDGPLAATVRISRDGAGRATHVLDPENRQWRFSYDGLGRTTSLSTPEAGETRWRWDATGNVNEVESSTATWKMKYDAIGRLLERRATDRSGLSSIATYQYDGAAGGRGLPWITTTADVEVQIAAYDQAGRAVAIEKRIGEDQFTFHRTLDELGRLRELRNPSGDATVYEYEGQRLVRVQHAGAEVLHVMERDARGRPTLLDYAGGIRRSLRYCEKAKGSPACEQRVEQEGHLLFEERLFFDAHGNVRSVQDPHRGNRVYSFDELNRLVNAHEATGQRFWSYDASGNRIFDSAYGDATYEPGTSRLTRLGDLRFSYDAAGRVVQRGNHEIRYQPDGQLREIVGRDWRTTYRYDSDGGLVKSVRQARGLKKVARWLTSRPTKIETLSPGFGFRCVGHECSQRILAGGHRIATSGAGGLKIEFQDYRGSLVRTAGAGDGAWTYDAFGMIKSGDDTSNASFAGYEADPMWPGLYFAHSRFYDSELGRFLTPDPLTGIGSSSQSLNRYAYAHNNPVTLVDPSGELPVLIVAILVGAAIGAAAGGIMAAIHGGNVWTGMVRGAFYGGLMGAVGYFAAPSMAGAFGPLVRVVGGGAAGWATAEVFGGDRNMAVVMGFVGAMAGLATQGSGVNLFGDSQADPWANLANQLATDARNGSIRGLVLGTMMGMDPLESAAYGAVGGMVGGQVPNVIGHLYGFAFGVIGTGAEPKFSGGAWHYKVDNWGMQDGAAVTFGNVIAFDDEKWGNLITIDHEMTHVGDWGHQGMGFAVGYVTSMPFVGLIDQQHVYWYNPYEPHNGHAVGDVPAGPFGSKW